MKNSQSSNITNKRSQRERDRGRDILGTAKNDIVDNGREMLLLHSLAEAFHFLLLPDKGTRDTCHWCSVSLYLEIKLKAYTLT